MTRFIRYKENLLGIVISAEQRAKADSIDFFTSNESSLQLGIMSRSKGYIVKPHVHKSVRREIHQTQEVLLIRFGNCLITFYNEAREIVEKIKVCTGDVVMFVNGGHAIEMLEETEILEVKQGPYLGELDKDRFEF